MAFGQELKDFVNGFTTGYQLIDSPEEKEREREKFRMEKEGFERTGKWREEDMKYREDRAKRGDWEWDTNYGRARERDARSDEEFDMGVQERARQRAIDEQRRKDELLRDTGGAIPDDVNKMPLTGTGIPGEVQSMYQGTGSPTNGPGREQSAAPSTGLQPTSASVGSDNVWLRYANAGATRNKPISAELEGALAKIAPELGIEVEVFSGGQDAKGEGDRRTGSVRHDHGNAADVFFYKDGRKLDWNNPKDRPLYEEIVRRGKGAGITGFGAGPGYMQAGSMHVGFGDPSVWGKGDKSENAPSWLANAYYGRDTQMAGSYANGGMIEGAAIPDEEDDGIAPVRIELAQAPAPAEPVETALPEEGPIPATRPQYDGVQEGDDLPAEDRASDKPTDDPYETSRRAVREGLKRAIQLGEADAETAINDPEMQKLRDRYIRGYGAAPQQVVKQIMDRIDPERKMNPTERNMLAYANTYRFFWERGEPEKAKEAAMSLVQYHRQNAQRFLALGQAAAQQGDYDKAAQAAVAAYTNIPNGRDLKINKVDGGYEISVTDVSTGKQVNKKVVSPEEFGAAAMGFNPGTFEEELLNAAGVPGETYDQASLEDTGKVEETVSAYIEDRFGGEGDPKRLSALRDIATGIATNKANVGLGPQAAVDLAMTMSAFNADDPESTADSFKVSTIRGNKDYVKVTTVDGVTAVVPKNAFARLSGLRSSLVTEKKGQMAEDAASAKRRSEMWGNLQKGVAAFGGLMGENMEKSMDPAPRNSAEAGAAIGGMLKPDEPAIPDGSAAQEGPALPSSADPELPAEVRELLETRENIMSTANPERFADKLKEVEARLTELGYM